jgi:hypothetical protein
MKTRREFLATTIAAAALLTNSSGQAEALSGLSTVDEIGRNDMVSNDPVSGGQYMGLIREKIQELRGRASLAPNK